MIVAKSDCSLKHDRLGVGYALYEASAVEGDLPIETGHYLLEELFDYDTVCAEYRAIISAVRAATQYDEDSILVYSDCMDAVRAIRYDEKICDGYLHHALHSFLGRFEEWNVRRIPRTQNATAHNEARMAWKEVSEVL